MTQTITNRIAGAAVRAAGRDTTPVFNPASGEEIARVVNSGASEIDDAVDAARNALGEWAAMPALKRARFMFRFKQLLDEHADDLAREISREHGKTHDDALGEVQRGIEVVDFACGIPALLKGSYSRNIAPALDSYSDRQPLGVVAGITPFNFPAMVPMWMYPIAIACGNTFILKPSERDPSAPTFAWELFQQADFPDGVLNVVHGGKQAVDAILDHRGIAAVSFVGSTPVAEYVFARGTAQGKRVQALGGAKNHMIVMPDADMDQASDALMGAAFGSAGERCMAVSVAVPVGGDTADRLVENLVPRIQALKIGPSTDAQAQMGPLITRQHLEKVTGHIEKGVAEGADLKVDGRGVSMQGYEDGFFIGGSLFDHVTTDMSIYREEIFGPVLSVARAGTYDEAVAMINAHEFANGTAIFTRDGDAARDFAERIEVGMVGINVPIPVPAASHSFGGWKRSLFGDYAVYGPEGVNFYTRLKTVSARWPAGIRSGAEFTFPSLE